MITITSRTTTRTPRTILLLNLLLLLLNFCGLVLGASDTVSSSIPPSPADDLLPSVGVGGIEKSEKSTSILTSLIRGKKSVWGETEVEEKQDKDADDDFPIIGQTSASNSDLLLPSISSSSSSSSSRILSYFRGRRRDTREQKRNPAGGGHQPRAPNTGGHGGGPNKKKKGNGNKLSAETFDTLGYKHDEGVGSVSLLWFTMAFMIVVLPPAVFVCIYSPGECLIAIGIAQLFIGGILHYVHSQDPYQFKYPWHTSPYLYVATGFLWILAGLWKLHIQTQIRELEEEEAQDRRRKYSERRTRWEEETSRERRRREREQRRRRKQQSQLRIGGGSSRKITLPPPFPLNRGPSAYELVPLNQRKSSAASSTASTNHYHNINNHMNGPPIPSWDGDDDEDESFHTV